MTVVAAIFALVAYEAVGATRRELALPAGIGVAGLVLVPVATVAVAAGVAAAWWGRSLRSRRQSAEAVDRDVLALVELVGLGLTAGMTFRSALLDAASEAHPVLAREVRTELRHAAPHGVLTLDTPRLRPLGLVASRVATTGAPACDAVRAHVRDLRGEERARGLAAARRLPVKLLFPLALLILPGFLMLTVVPTVVAGFERLGL